MNSKNNFSLLFFLILILCSFYSCSDSDEQEKTPIYAQLNDVALTQAINGKELLELTKSDEILTFSSQLSFNEKTIKWSKPTLESAFDQLFDLSKENITVTDSKGNIISCVDILLKDHTVKISFRKLDNSFSYMTSSTFIVDIKTKIRKDATEKELIVLNNNGFNSYSIFYSESPEQKITSNTAKITSKLDLDAEYKVKGDPNNASYPYKLNIVYFIPSDIHANPGYKKRISTILLKHQLFVCKWMKHWGYGERSFGLPLDENGMVNIVTVNGQKNRADYLYSSGAKTMADEIKAYYSANNLTKYSEHTLVLTATNGNVENIPFFGLGKWCYALDYQGMSYDLYNIDPITNNSMNPTPLKSASIGGMLHELGHGLNEPHVGPTYSQKNNPEFGMSLMGSGNRTYGKKPTFMHHASAAIMNNCQISSLTKKTFYGKTNASIKISGVSIDGSNCTVKGSFTASEKVTDVIIRFYNSTEEFLGGASGYTSVAFVAKPTGNNFELTIPVEEMKVNSFTYRVGVSILMENGTSKSTSQPYTYKLINTTSGYTFECEDILNDGSWEVITSHQLPEDASISNAPGSLVDGDESTCLSMVKPGKTHNGVSVLSTEQVYVIIDFKKQIEFNTIVLTNRNFQPHLNAKAASFYGSNDGNTFTPIKTEVVLPENKENTITFDKKVKYQYLKMTLDAWNPDLGNTMQFTELRLKNI